MKVDAIWSAVGLPVIGLVVGLYHKFAINPRLTKVEDETIKNTRILMEIKGGQNVIIDMLKSNGFKQKKK